MRARLKRWAGIDVGGRRKGFHGVVVDDSRLVAGPARLPDPKAVADWLSAYGPSVVGIDSPSSCAAPGERSRAGERDLARAVCGIRWTLERGLLDGNPYYEWVLNGLDLYRRLSRSEDGRAQLIEVFPTAAWTRWSGPRNGRPRSAWSQAALEELRLPGLPGGRLSQDDRDAVAAALTARQHGRGETEHFGEIVVPLR